MGEVLYSITFPEGGAFYPIGLFLDWIKTTQLSSVSLCPLREIFELLGLLGLSGYWVQTQVTQATQ
jgi:hypothetical protein